MKNFLLLMMGGSGVRFGGQIPKQFVKVNGNPVFSYILKGYEDCEFIDSIAVVSHKDWKDYVKEWADRLEISKLCVIAEGGDTRSESVKNGLNALESRADEKDVVLIHDATHPYVDKGGTKQVIEAVKEYGGATLGQRQYDTVYQMDENSMMLERVVNRKSIVSGASPEAFFYGDIHRIYGEASKEQLEAMTSAGAIALEYGIPMKVIPSNVLNLKITYKSDMDTFEKMAGTCFPQM